MNESFLHYIWKYKLLKHELYTTAGEFIEILKQGEYNTNSGADFFDSRIRMGDTLWVGNVEVHKRSSDWNTHKHEKDASYNNVILHVVYEDDLQIKNQKGETIPTLVLKGSILEHIIENYREIFASRDTVLCAKSIAEVNPMIVKNTLDRLAVQRLERKTEEVKLYLTQSKNSWEDTFYWLLAKYFGSSINALPFELVAKSISTQILAKHKNDLLQLEALLFGQAGMLDKEFDDEYPNQLKKEYHFLKAKYKLNPIDAHLWKFLRLRPSNFPTLRLSQFAGLIFKSSHLFSKILETNDIQKLFSYFDVEVSAYWNTHYIFDKESVKKEKKLGNSLVNTLLINVVVPILFEYGTQHTQEKYRETALEILENLPSENNHIIAEWKNCKMKVENALQSQALLEMYKNYCKEKQCLSCQIGFQILNRK